MSVPTAADLHQLSESLAPLICGKAWSTVSDDFAQFAVQKKIINNKQSPLSLHPPLKDCRCHLSSSPCPMLTGLMERLVLHIFTVEPGESLRDQGSGCHI